MHSIYWDVKKAYLFFIIINKTQQKQKGMFLIKNIFVILINYFLSTFLFKEFAVSNNKKNYPG